MQNTDKMASLKLALFILFTLTAMSSVAADTCGPCACFNNTDQDTDAPGLKVAFCSGLTMTTVPVDLHADIQELNVQEGSISTLSDSQFTSYRRLQRIILYSNHIQQIEQGSFRYIMTNLTYIDLSSNAISELPTEWFTFSPNIITVALYDNIIKRLQSHLFNNLKYLKQVYLHNNEINTIEDHCFADVPQLEEIHLSNNKLIVLDIKFIDNASSLKVLYLEDNPWHCDTSLCGVMDTAVSRELWSDQSAPTCATPQNLTEREWSKPLVKELCSCFWCNCTNAPLIISNTSSVSEGQDLQLRCQYCNLSRIVWTYNDVKLPFRYVEKSEESLTSTLTIKNILREQRGYYLCKIRSCEDCEDDGVYVSVTGNPQSHVDLKQVVDVPPEPQPSCDAPRIISNTSSVSEGQDLQLKCQYCNLSRIVWTYNDVTLPSRYEEKSEESLTSTLTIKNILREQRGYYLCKIRSCEDCEDDGVYVSVTGNPQSHVDLKQVVDVPPEPQPSCDAPRIISNTSSVSEGQDLQLKCQYCNLSRIVWTYNDVTLPSRYEEKSEQSLTSTLTVTNVVRGQQGYYLCKIRSCEDCRNDGVYISVTDKPQSHVDLKQVVHVPGVNSSESCSGILLQTTVVAATELNTTLNDKN